MKDRCPACQETLPADARFCPWCGETLQGTASTQRIGSARIAAAIEAAERPRRRAWIVGIAGAAVVVLGAAGWLYWSSRQAPAPGEPVAEDEVAAVPPPSRDVLQVLETRARAGDLEAATAAVKGREAWLQEEANALESLRALGSLHARLGQYERAATWLEAAAAAGTDLAPAERAGLLSDAATAHALAGAERRALQLLDEATRLAPGAPLPRYNRGALRLHLGHPADALQDLEPACAALPGHAGAQAARTHALLGLGRVAEAQKAAELALAAEPGSPVAMQAAGAAALASGDLARAAELARLAEAALPHRAEIDSLAAAAR